MKQWLIAVAGIGLLLGIPNDLPAQTSTEERLEQLEQEIQEIKDQSLKSETYEAESNNNISFHGYGELHYNNPRGSNVPDDDDPAQMDFHRMVWGLTYYWTDQISLHTEVDFEHAAQEMELEYAYVDFLVNPAFNVRAGAVLMPAGPLNEFHEPTLFYSVERPYVQNAIIPTTWQEGGVGITGGLPVGLRYRLYYVSGLDAEGFSASTGIRGGRTHVAEAPSEEMAVVGRLEYVGLPGIQVGGSYYTGGASQLETTPDVSVSIMEVDASAKYAGLEIRGLYAAVNVDGADDLSAALGQTIGEQMVGTNVEAAFHLLPLIIKETDQDLVLFARWEQFNTQEEVPAEYEADPSNDRQVLTYGLAYFPHRDVAIKADFERWENEADADDEGNRFNLGLAYMFP